MNLYESIKSKLNEAVDSDWEALKQGLSSCKSASDVEELMLETLSSSDYSRYCDYHYEIDDNDKSTLSWAKKELKKLANENSNDEDDEFANELTDEKANRQFDARWHSMLDFYDGCITLMKNFLKSNNLRGNVTRDCISDWGDRVVLKSNGKMVAVYFYHRNVNTLRPPYDVSILLGSKDGRSYNWNNENHIAYELKNQNTSVETIANKVYPKLDKILKDYIL